MILLSRDQHDLLFKFFLCVKALKNNNNLLLKWTSNSFHPCNQEKHLGHNDVTSLIPSSGSLTFILRHLSVELTIWRIEGRRSPDLRSETSCLDITSTVSRTSSKTSDKLLTMRVISFKQSDCSTCETGPLTDLHQDGIQKVVFLGGWNSEIGHERWRFIHRELAESVYRQTFWCRMSSSDDSNIWLDRLTTLLSKFYLVCYTSCSSFSPVSPLWFV